MVERAEVASPQLWLEVDGGAAALRRASRQHCLVRVHGEPTHDKWFVPRGSALLVDTELDAEVGSLVLWWNGSLASLALAEVGPGYELRSAMGFPPPRVEGIGQALRGQSGAEVLGVCIGLRSDPGEACEES